MNSTTVPAATTTATTSSVHPKKPPVPVKPRSIPPPPNPLLASAASALNTPKGSIRTSLLAQRLEETLRLGLGELEVVQPTRHAKPSGQSEDTTGKHVLSGGGGGDADGKQKKQSAEEHNLQAALQAEMRRQCGSIKARFLLERRLPQNGSVEKELTGHIQQTPPQTMSNTVEDDAGIQGQNVLERISSLLNGGSSGSSTGAPGTAVAPGSLVLEDISQTRTVHEEEILLINGIPVRLPAENSDHSTASDGTDDDAASIRDALRAGEIPSILVLNRIIEKLHRSNPGPSMVVAVETSLTVSNCRKTTETCVVQPIPTGRTGDPVVDPWEVTEERVEKQLYNSRTVEMTEGYRGVDANAPCQKHCWPSGSVDSGQWTETDAPEVKQTADPLYTKADDLLLHYTEGNLISGSLDGLLTHFTP
uniref:Uncharacterized protein n=1 Tax=Anopheles maculatus TaxID=74869 RepID=A0A182STT8_9DIPT